MALRLAEQFIGSLPELRCFPTAKRIRAVVGDETVVDTTDAQLVWEPRRVVPSYAVPIHDVHGTLARADNDAASEQPIVVSGVPVLDPGTGFAAHTCDGQPLTIHSAGRNLDGAAFAPSDPDLHGYVVLDFYAFDEWIEEDEPIVGHPRDPFKRIDIRRSSRHVVLEVAGTTIADSARPHLLFETYLPVRYYLPSEDVRMDLMQPTETRTTCAYKGHASYWSVVADGNITPDIAWTYQDPLDDATRVRGLVSFFTERIDLILDGRRLERPVTPWS